LLLHDESPEAVEARESAFLVKTYARTPFHPRDGKGARLIDADGRVIGVAAMIVAGMALAVPAPEVEALLASSG
jgi:acetylornithine/succinyldiaminopimelate/putrescine aminotransferase